MAIEEGWGRAYPTPLSLFLLSQYNSKLNLTLNSISGECWLEIIKSSSSHMGPVWFISCQSLINVFALYIQVSLI
jgi:hypothetical protein